MHYILWRIKKLDSLQVGVDDDDDLLRHNARAHFGSIFHMFLQYFSAS